MMTSGAILDVFVRGKPVTKGSMTPSIAMRYCPRRRRKVAVPIARASNPDLKGWEWDISMAVSGAFGRPLAPDTPVRVDMTFHVDRQKTSHTASPIGRRAGDLDKLVRAVLDGMTRALFHDDKDVVELRAKKQHAGPDGTGVHIVAYLVGPAHVERD